MGSTEFFCLCPPKAVHLEDREEATARQLAGLQESLGQKTFHGRPGRVLLLAGGGVVVEASAPRACIGQHGHCIAAFSGRIENYAYLVKKYLLDKLKVSLDVATATLEDISTAASVTEAELLCLLYDQLGRTMPLKLRGEYNFVLYDSNLVRPSVALLCYGQLQVIASCTSRGQLECTTQTRVLAVCSPTAEKSLLQARGADNSLIISSQAENALPEGCHSMVAIPPGHFKYGWNSGVLQYAKPKTEACQSRADAAAAAKRALSGLLPKSSNASGGQEFGFSGAAGQAPSEPPSPGYKRTRRGKRAGANQKLRASGELARTSFDLRRLSFEYMGASSLQSAASFSSRADEQGWWRSDTPRAGTSSTQPASPFMRRSLTATASPFQPQEPPATPFFGRESVPAAVPQPSAICIPARMKTAEPAALPKAQPAPSAQPVQYASQGAGTGQADAAWHEGEGKTWPVAQTTLACNTSLDRGTAGLSPVHMQGRIPPTRSSGPGFAPVPAMPAQKASPSLRSSSASSRDCSPTPGGTSPKRRAQRFRPPFGPSSSSDASLPGASPGGSPRRPPRAPVRASFGSLLRAMLPRRPSRPDLRSEGNQLSHSGSRLSARSSSHGNLVDLDRPTGLWDAPMEAPECSASQMLERATMQRAVAGNESTSSLLHELPAELVELLAGGDETAVRMLHKLVASPSHGLMVTSASQPESSIMYVNATFERETGYQADEVLGRNPRFLQTESGAKRMPSPPSIVIRKALELGQGTRVRILNYTKAGVPLWNDLSILPLRDSAGDIQHMMGVQSFQVAEGLPDLAKEAQEKKNNANKSGLNILVRRTRGLFSKSKSCNDIATMEVHPSLQKGLQAH